MKQIVLLSPYTDLAGSLNDYTLIRLSKLLAEHPVFNCTVVSCRDLCFTESAVLVQQGATFGSNGLRVTSFEKPFTPDYVYFHSITDGANCHSQCVKLLKSIAERGVPVSYDADCSSLGVKSVLEERCSEFESESGLIIPRPRTMTFKGATEHAKAVEFMRRGGPYILKPHNSSRARGIRILIREEQVERLILDDDWYVLQELIAAPMTMNGYKVGLRVYLTISDTRTPTYKILDQGLLKWAVQPYLRGNPQSEIVGTSYAKRLGFNPVIYLFKDLIALGAIAPSEWTDIWNSIEKTLSLFTEAIAWRAGMYHKTPPSFLFWGVDIAIQMSNDGPKAYLIEVNTFPALYRNDPVTDDALDRVLVADLFAAAVDVSL